jgi:CheY-like chemotaxis protein
MEQKASILYVDDDKDDQTVFVEALKELHPSYHCYLAFNGVEALKLLHTVDAPICIYLDINMPLMNGFETLKELKANASLKKIPVFILSTSRSSSQEIEARKLGAADYLLKPNAYYDFIKILGDCFQAHIKT